MKDLFKIRNEMIEDVTVENAYGFVKEEIVKIADERFVEFVKENYEQFDEDNWEQLLQYAFESDTQGNDLFSFIIDYSDGYITSERLFNDAMEYAEADVLLFIFDTFFSYNNTKRRQVQDRIKSFESELYDRLKDTMCNEGSGNIYISRDKNNIISMMRQYLSVYDSLNKI